MYKFSYPSHEKLTMPALSPTMEKVIWMIYYKYINFLEFFYNWFITLFVYIKIML